MKRISSKEVYERTLQLLTERGVTIPAIAEIVYDCLLYTSPSPRDAHESRMPSSA